MPQEESIVPFELKRETIKSLAAPIPAVPVVPVEPVQPKGEFNVMIAMLEKMSTKNKALVPIEVNLPAPAVYDLLKEQMDVNEEDLNDQISMLIESQINNMKESLKEQISSFIINYYQK